MTPTRMAPTRMEIVPTGDIVAKIRSAVPLTTALTITCLPHHGVHRTIHAALELSELGYSVIPHLAARSLESRAELAGIIKECEAVGINEVLAIAGDAAQPAGPYHSSLPLMEEIADLSGGAIGIGIAGYPEGHRHISGQRLLDVLIAKQHLATHVVTQMCFSASKIENYTRLLHERGVELPVWAGVAGAVPRAKLVSLAIKIGVGSSLNFLRRQRQLGRRVLDGGDYSPGHLISQLGEFPAGIAGIHLFSFNSFADGSTVTASGDRHATNRV